MASAVPARLSAADGRKFGLTVGAAFLALAAIALWRGRGSALYLGVLGALLVLASLVIPTRLGPLQRGWMAVAHVLSRVTTPIVMGVVYYVVLSPIGVVMRMFGRNPLRRRMTDGTYWVNRADDVAQPGSMERQF